MCCRIHLNLHPASQAVPSPLSPPQICLIATWNPTPHEDKVASLHMRHKSAMLADRQSVVQRTRKRTQGGDGGQRGRRVVPLDRHFGVRVRWEMNIFVQVRWLWSVTRVPREGNGTPRRPQHFVENCEGSIHVDVNIFGEEER